MNTKLFSEAMSEVNDKYYEEAANYHCKKHGWVKFTSLAACAAIVLAVSFATLWKLPSQTTPQPEYEPPIITNPDALETLDHLMETLAFFEAVTLIFAGALIAAACI